MSKPKIKSIFLLFALALAIFSFMHPATVQARGLVPCGGVGENPCNVKDIFYLIARVTNWLIGMAGLYAVFQIVSAGFWMIASMGNEEGLTKWRKALSNAVVGFVLVMLAYIFVNTAANFILANQTDGKTIDLKNPFCYITNGQKCVVSK